jgi:hypothetical protein
VLDAFLAHPDAEVAAVCDLSQAYMDFASKKAGTSPRQFKDYRQLLEMKDLDAVVIATPDHWHALQTIAACQAGKDVYTEKPLSLCVAEAGGWLKRFANINACPKSGFTAVQSRCVRRRPTLCAAVGWGKVTAARAFHVQNEWPSGIGHPADGEPPTGLIGMRGWDLRPNGSTTRTGRSIVFDGSMTTAEGR